MIQRVPVTDRLARATRDRPVGTSCCAAPQGDAPPGAMPAAGQAASVCKVGARAGYRGDGDVSRAAARACSRRPTPEKGVPRNSVSFRQRCVKRSATAQIG